MCCCTNVHTLVSGSMFMGIAYMINNRVRDEDRQ